jgi:hypothetical protein
MFTKLIVCANNVTLCRAAVTLKQLIMESVGCIDSDVFCRHARIGTGAR